MFKTKIKRVNWFYLALVMVSSYNLSSAAAVFYDNSVAGQSSITLKSPGAPQMAGNTGGLNYSYDFEIPSGRNGMNPDLSLSLGKYSKMDPIFINTTAHSHTLRRKLGIMY